MRDEKRIESVVSIWWRAMMMHSGVPFLPSRFTGVRCLISHMLRGDGQRGFFSFLMLLRLTELRCLISQMLRGDGWGVWSDVVLFRFSFLMTAGRGVDTRTEVVEVG